MLREQLYRSADAARKAWPGWRRVGRQWDVITTTQAHSSLNPVGGELPDLVLRVGRLVFRNPSWTPARTDAAPARDPARLAPAVGDIVNIAASIHHAVDALAMVASTDRQAIEAVGIAQLYVPTRLLPEYYDIPHPYTRCPAGAAIMVLGSYDEVVKSSASLTTELDELATLTGRPSELLAAPRRNPPPRPARDHGFEHEDAAGISLPQPGRIEELLHSLRITEPSMITRAELADANASALVAEALAKSGRRQDTTAQNSQRPR